MDSPKDDSIIITLLLLVLFIPIAFIIICAYNAGIEKVICASTNITNYHQITCDQIYCKKVSWCDYPECRNNVPGKCCTLTSICENRCKNITKYSINICLIDKRCSTFIVDELKLPITCWLSCGNEIKINYANLLSNDTILVIFTAVIFIPILCGYLYYMLMNENTEESQIKTKND